MLNELSRFKNFFSHFFSSFKRFSNGLWLRPSYRQDRRHYVLGLSVSARVRACSREALPERGLPSTSS